MVTTVKENFTLTLVKTVGKNLFKSIAIRKMAMESKIRLNCEYSEDSWGFIAKKQSKGAKG